MIREVKLGQHQLKVAGFYIDERGIATASKVAIIFHDISRVIAFFRSYSKKNTIEHINSELTLQQSRSTNGNLDMLLHFNLDESHSIDQIAEIAKHHRARAFIGHDRIFLPFRDRSAPLGYDIDESHILSIEQEKATRTDEQISFFSKTGIDRRENGRESSLQQLFKRLSLIPFKNSQNDQEAEMSHVILRVKKGLLQTVMRYLFERHIDATIRQAYTRESSIFDVKNIELSLFDCPNVPAFLLRSLSQTPGISIFTCVDDNLFVEWGYQHPIALESCTGLFDEGFWHLFYKESTQNESISVEENQLSISDFMSISINKQKIKRLKPSEIDLTPIEHFQVSLKFVPFLYVKNSPPQAVLIPLSRLDWMNRLLYLLPASLIHHYKACIVSDFLIVISHEGVEGIPFGIPLREAYSSLFFPFDMELLPRIEERFLRQAFSLSDESKYYFFIPNELSEENRIQDKKSLEIKHLLTIGQGEFKSLSRSVLSKEHMTFKQENAFAQPSLEELSDSIIMHEKLDGFSLWGKK